MFVIYSRSLSYLPLNQRDLNFTQTDLCKCTSQNSAYLAKDGKLLIIINVDDERHHRLFASCYWLIVLLVIHTENSLSQPSACRLGIHITSLQCITDKGLPIRYIIRMNLFVACAVTRNFRCTQILHFVLMHFICLCNMRIAILVLATPFILFNKYHVFLFWTVQLSLYLTICKHSTTLI